MQVQSEEAGLLGEASVLHGPLPAQEGSTHFRVTVSMSGQQLQENTMLSAAQTQHQGRGREAGDQS